MPDTAHHLKGELYSTHMTQRCLAFKPCSYCRMCENFDKNSATCNYCEGRKPKEWRTCNCGEKKHLLKMLEQRFNKPMFSLDGTKAPTEWSENIPLDTTNEALISQIHTANASNNVKVVDQTEDSTMNVEIDSY